MMCYMHPGGASLLIRPGLSIRVPPGGFHNVLYAPPGGFHNVLYAPPGGAGLLFRPEFDDSCAPRWLT